MREMFRKPLVVFIAVVLFLAAVFFLIPINLFDGEIVFNVNGVTFTEKAKLSLSYFIGIGASEEQTKDVVDFYLLPMGYFFVFLFLIALPALIAYRVHIANLKDRK